MRITFIRHNVAHVCVNKIYACSVFMKLSVVTSLTVMMKWLYSQSWSEASNNG